MFCVVFVLVLAKLVVVFKGDFVFSSSSLEFVMQVLDWFGLTSLGLGPQLPDLL